MTFPTVLNLLLSLFIGLSTTTAKVDSGPEQIRLVDDFSLSPDGSSLVFSWRGNIWTAPTAGGTALPLTGHEALDRDPCFAPDGQEIAFTSNRTGSDQIHVMPASGGDAARRLTHHTEGYRLVEYYPDGMALLTTGSRDHFWRLSTRFLKIPRRERGAEATVFDANGEAGTLSPDGKKMLFTREGTNWFRKRYRGSQASQVWMHDLDSGEFSLILKDDVGFRYPQWRADGNGFYYVGQQDGAFNLYEYDLASEVSRQITHYEDDAVFWPTLSRDGSTLVYRHLFDLYRIQPGIDETPNVIDLYNGGETPRKPVERRNLSSADDASFSKDGLETAFISGGDLWVMDTELREPRRITSSPEREREPLFVDDGKAIIFVSDSGGSTDIWKAERADPTRYWWQNDQFTLTRITNDPQPESSLKMAPTGKRLAFVHGRGNIVTCDLGGNETTTVLTGWDRPSFDWSPDGRWITYSRNDSDFNRDVWIKPIDNSREPYNISVHPDNDSGPVWSPDGKVIAFTGRRTDDETDVFYVWLRKEDFEKRDRDRKMEKALKKMKKGRKKKDDGSKKEGKDKGEENVEENPDPRKGENKDGEDTDDSGDEPEEKSDDRDVVSIDFEELRDRIRRVSISNSAERGLFWMDEDTLAFTASGKEGSGTYSISFPDELTPKRLTSERIASPIRLEKGKGVGGISSSKPAILSTKGKATTYSFTSRQEIDVGARYRAAFQEAWRHMRDGFYDERLGNRDWEDIRIKYIDAAENASDIGDLKQVVSLMLGELNASHLGFSARSDRYQSEDDWSDTTAHIGVRLDPTHPGPGWRIRDVVQDGPADREGSELTAGEVILKIDSTEVHPRLDPTLILNGNLERDILLTVASENGDEREVTIRPIRYSEVRRLLYPMWQDANREKVALASDDKLGYLHIQGMNWSSFLRFEEELHKIAYGKDGLIIDVRGNGGGYTTDHLLTALTQPSHAITVPRDGESGYPQDRKVYASWDRPIVVLCDQDSFSNAEIFSHAIKSLGRGELVGVTTAGGVISTGSKGVLDVGSIRMPYRGWYVKDTGEDMELNGAEPHHILWPDPGDIPAGKDVQLQKAIEVLQEIVEKEQGQERPTLKKASERKAG